jgi:hypothetical protein
MHDLTDDAMRDTEGDGEAGSVYTSLLSMEQTPHNKSQQQTLYTGIQRLVSLQDGEASIVSNLPHPTAPVMQRQHMI